LLPFALSPLLSLRGKLRVGADLLVPPSQNYLRRKVSPTSSAVVSAEEALYEARSTDVGGIYTPIRKSSA